MSSLTKEEIKSMSEGIGLDSIKEGCKCKEESLTIEKALPMTEAEKFFAGIAVLVLVFGVLSIWVSDFKVVATTQFGALVGAACLKIKGGP